MARRLNTSALKIAFGHILVLVLSCILCQCGTDKLFSEESHSQPNVIFILTDDQGVGDLSCHGNPWLKTPHLDALHSQSIRLTDFHVSPYCTPTRSAFMTGQYPINNGAWATYKGRDALSKSAVTMADIFKHNGYRTGLFGKWHLGDNYPSRPTDSGFDVAVHHMAGGVGELSDYWGNTYFDDTYYVNNEPKKFEGYCTDVWFDEAMTFIDSADEKPFFVYIPTNAPHSPFYVDEKYAEPFKDLVGEEINNAEFLGMISNIDENMGKLEALLKRKNLADNTILIFATDNGTSSGISRDGKLGYNKGFRGIKGSKYEGGHRAAFFIRWPAGNIQGGRDINKLTAHVDLLPTLSALCKLDRHSKLDLDGSDLSPLLFGQDMAIDDRVMFIHHRQDWRAPFDIQETCIMQHNWRLINGSELYNVKDDPGQQFNLAAKFPRKREQLLQHNDVFIQRAKNRSEYQQLPTHIIGNEAQEEITLTIQHAIGEDKGIWKCEQVAAGMKNTNNTHALEVESAGLYSISCRRWPKEHPGAVLGVPTKDVGDSFTYQPIRADKVRIKIGDEVLEQDVKEDVEEVVFRVPLKKGRIQLTNDFIEGDESFGVYYTYIQKIKS